MGSDVTVALKLLIFIVLLEYREIHYFPNLSACVVKKTNTHRFNFKKLHSFGDVTSVCVTRKKKKVCTIANCTSDPIFGEVMYDRTMFPGRGVREGEHTLFSIFFVVGSRTCVFFM